MNKVSTAASSKSARDILLLISIFKELLGIETDRSAKIRTRCVNADRRRRSRTQQRQRRTVRHGTEWPSPNVVSRPNMQYHGWPILAAFARPKGLR